MLNWIQRIVLLMCEIFTVINVIITYFAGLETTSDTSEELLSLLTSIFITGIYEIDTD